MKKDRGYWTRIAAVAAAGWMGCAIPALGQVPFYLLTGALSWEAVDSNHYRIILQAYHHCQYNPLNTQFVNVYYLPVGAPLSTRSTLTLFRTVNGENVVPLCSTACSKCTNPGSCYSTPFSAAMYQFEDTLDVSALRAQGVCELLFYWGECCRSSSIDNLSDPIAKQTYASIQLNICQPTPNQPPALTHAPGVAFWCKNSPVVYPMPFDDPDGDSVVVSLVGARELNNSTAATQPYQYLPYATGYSATSPLRYLGYPTPNMPLPLGFHLDSGMLRFKPTFAMTSIIAYEIREYRQGQRISTTYRELYGVVRSCAEAPVIVGARNYTVCEGDSICAVIKTYDPDTADSVSLWWSALPPEATFTWIDTVNHSQSIWGPELHICWAPSSNVPVGKTYRVFLKASDDHCPEQHEAYQMVSFTKTPPPSIGFSTIPPSNDTFCDDHASIILRADPTGGMWSGPYLSGDTFRAADAPPGTYTFTYTWAATGCAAEDSFAITLLPLPSVSANLSLDTICHNMPPIPLTNGTPPGGTYSGPAVTNGTFDPALADTGQWTPIYYTYTNSFGCSATDTHQVYVKRCVTTSLTGPSPAPPAIKVDHQLGHLAVEGEGIERVRIFTAEGKLWWHQQSAAPIAIHHWPPGTYIVELTTPHTVAYRVIRWFR